MFDCIRSWFFRQPTKKQLREELASVIEAKGEREAWFIEHIYTVEKYNKALLVHFNLAVPLMRKTRLTRWEENDRNDVLAFKAENIKLVSILQLRSLEADQQMPPL